MLRNQQLGLHDTEAFGSSTAVLSVLIAIRFLSLAHVVKFHVLCVCSNCE